MKKYGWPELSLYELFLCSWCRIHKNWCTFQNLISITGGLKPHHVLLRPSIFVFLYYIIKHTKYWKLKCSVFSPQNCNFLNFLTVGVHKSWVTEFCAEVPNVFNISTPILSLTKMCMISLLQAAVPCNSEGSVKLASCHPCGT